MQFNPGTNGSVSATTLENQFYTIAALIQFVEQDDTKNPNEANAIESSLDLDEYSFSGTINIFAVHSLDSGVSQLSYPDPYLNSGWIEGTSGDGNAANLNQAIAERALILAAAERNPTNNPNAIDPKLTTIAWSYQDTIINTPVSHNCILTISFNLEIESTTMGDGAAFKAKEYLIS
jgi:hypothetical protein